MLVPLLQDHAVKQINKLLAAANKFYNLFFLFCVYDVSTYQQRMDFSSCILRQSYTFVIHE